MLTGGLEEDLVENGQVVGLQVVVAQVEVVERAVVEGHSEEGPGRRRRTEPYEMSLPPCPPTAISTSLGGGYEVVSGW